MCIRDRAWTGRAHEEWRRLCSQIPKWYRLANHLIYRWVNFKRRVVSLRIKAPAVYDAYAGDEEERTRYNIERPTVIWKKRVK